MGTYFFVDRISDGLANLTWDHEGGGDAIFPLSMLPHGVREGDWLDAAFSIDLERVRAMRDEIDSLMEELGDAP